MNAIRAGVLGLAMLLATGHARAELKDQAANGFTVENSQWVPTTPEQTWRGLVQDVGQWWPADHTWWGDAGKRASTRAPAAASAKSMASGRPGT